ncbi:MAG: hypothetical protein KatS3mg114_1097 [Planctomycetaceae bacterium]|nr:MAG: hypothetical protein KatS3mg114_1097 [Planctomycetaceae bacterium]
MTIETLCAHNTSWVARPSRHALLQDLLQQDPEWGYAPRWFYREGLRWHYVDAGEGAPVVMIHGNPSWCYLWRRLIRVLSVTHRCLAWDHMGCGLSDRPTDRQYRFTLKQRIDDLSAWFQHLALDEAVTLVGHDWGGMIACGLAQRFPERVARLIMFNTAAFPLPAGRPFPWTLALARTPGLGPLLVRGANAFCRGAWRYGVTSRCLTQRIRRMYLLPYATWHDRLAVLRFVQDIPLQPQHPSYECVVQIQQGLEQLRQKPWLLVWGTPRFHLR